MSSQVDAPFPFIVGRNRSGTTLLRAMFDSHPEMAVPHESHLIVPVLKNRRRYETHAGVDIDLFARDARMTWSQRWGCPEDELRTILAKAEPTTVQGCLRAMFGAYAARQGKARYGEKTPVNALHLAFLASQFPEARFIHIVRDGRDVAMSWRALHPGSSIGRSAILWKRFVEDARRDAARLGIARYREISFEQLTEEPQATLQDLCVFVDLAFDPMMLQYFERAEAVMSPRHPAHHENLTRAPVSGIRDWRTEMPAHEVAVFEALAGRSLERFGYRRQSQHLPLMARLRAGTTLFGFNADRARHRIEKTSRRTLKRLGANRSVVVGRDGS
ncbi:MAG: sulfotransferase family protein [Actinomycetota bacterium]